MSKSAVGGAGLGGGRLLPPREPLEMDKTGRPLADGKFSVTGGSSVLLIICFLGDDAEEEKDDETSSTSSRRGDAIDTSLKLPSEVAANAAGSTEDDSVEKGRAWRRPLKAISLSSADFTDPSSINS